MIWQLLIKAGDGSKYTDADSALIGSVMVTQEAQTIRSKRRRSFADENDLLRLAQTMGAPTDFLKNR
ncbi:MAG: hypothetical protein R2784_02125 [Saprospiraceae bacterium]